MTGRAVLGALALAAAALAGPATASAAPDNCVAWLGARGTGTCIGESSGLPQVGFNGNGIETGPLMPGTSINIPLG